MLRRTMLIIVAAFAVASSVHANDQLVDALKKLGNIVDQMAIVVSEIETDSDAEFLAQVIKQRLQQTLQLGPSAIQVSATRGSCSILIQAPHWQLWSLADNGKIIDHGAKIKNL